MMNKLLTQLLSFLNPLNWVKTAYYLILIPLLCLTAYAVYQVPSVNKSVAPVVKPVAQVVEPVARSILKAAKPVGIWIGVRFKPKPENLLESIGRRVRDIPQKTKEIILYIGKGGLNRILDLALHPVTLICVGVILWVRFKKS